MARTYYHSYTVTGTYPFPFDMLRYDSSFPSTEVDAALIHRIHDRHQRVDRQNSYVVRLTHAGENPKWQPTLGRWQSFGWISTDASLNY